MSSYWHRKVNCPFYITDDELRITCEKSSRIGFPDKMAIKSHLATYCCDKWKECTTAKMLLEYYERRERNG